MSDARVTSIALEVIRVIADTAGAGSSAGGASVVGMSPLPSKKVVACVITN